jgi:hypothetical protein
LDCRLFLYRLTNAGAVATSAAQVPGLQHLLVHSVVLTDSTAVAMNDGHVAFVSGSLRPPPRSRGSASAAPPRKLAPPALALTPTPMTLPSCSRYFDGIAAAAAADGGDDDEDAGLVCGGPRQLAFVPPPVDADRCTFRWIATGGQPPPQQQQQQQQEHKGGAGALWRAAAAAVVGAGGSAGSGIGTDGGQGGGGHFAIAGETVSFAVVTARKQQREDSEEGDDGGCAVSSSSSWSSSSSSSSFIALAFTTAASDDGGGAGGPGELPHFDPVSGERAAFLRACCVVLPPRDAAAAQAQLQNCRRMLLLRRQLQASRLLNTKRFFFSLR